MKKIPSAVLGALLTATLPAHAKVIAEPLPTADRGQCKLKKDSSASSMQPS
jgi:hypothetical protein